MTGIDEGQSMKTKALLYLALALFSLSSGARELGHYAPGVANIRDLAVPPAPGFYYEQYNVHYSTDTYKDRNGNGVDSIPTRRGAINIDPDIDIYAITPVFMWVTEKKIWGGDYAFYIAPTIADNSVSASLSTLNFTGSFGVENTGMGDLFVQPLWLGWRGARYDLSLGLGLYAPIGEYDEDADDNIGLGFWTGQIQGAGYYYLDDQQASAFLLAGTYEAHTSKDGTDITPGDHFTLEYGFSQYLSQRLEVGVAGFSHWQVEDDKGMILLDNRVDTEVHGIGAQISYWATPRLNISLKYMQEYNAKARTEGDWLMLNLTYLPGPLF
jgi:hypothetical protein